MNQPNSLTFSAFAPISLLRRSITEGTLSNYLHLLEHATPTLGKKRISSITPGHVQECLADCRDQLSPKTMQNLLKFIRSVLRDAGSTAADRLSVPVHEPSIRVLDVAETTCLRAHLSQLGTLEATALLVLLATGLRRGELLNLKVDDWRAGLRQLHVSKSKSRRVRDVDVPDWLADELTAVACLSGSGFLFPVTKDALRRLLDKACDAVDLPHIRVHDLRHTRVTYLLLQGVTPLYVSQQAGHSSPAFTLSRYGHLIAATPAQRRDWCNV